MGAAPGEHWRGSRSGCGSDVYGCRISKRCDCFLLHAPVAARAWFPCLAVQRQKIPLRRGRNYCDSARINCASHRFLVHASGPTSCDTPTVDEPHANTRHVYEPTAGRRVPDRGQRCQQRPLCCPSGRATAATSRIRRRRRAPALPTDVAAPPSSRRLCPSSPEQHGSETWPQAWATEMQLATKTMLRSVNKQRLGESNGRGRKDALAWSSPKDVRRASKLAGLLGL